MDNIVESLNKIITKYREELQRKIKERELEMKLDNNEHHIVYNALGFTNEEGRQIDFQQNVGRFLYKYAGSLMEELALTCFKTAHSDVRKKVKLPNTVDKTPKTVEIDCLIGNRAIELKWKDATTDGDHITKERKRVRIIQAAGYTPIRMTFFEPNRFQAIQIQAKLKQLYEELGGEYYAGSDAWEYLKNDSGIDLRAIIEKNGRRFNEL